jgi:hypothetical protein
MIWMNDKKSQSLARCFATPEGLRFEIRDRSLIWLDTAPASNEQPSPIEMTEMLFAWYLSQRTLPLPQGETGDRELGDAFIELLGGKVLQAEAQAA